VLHRGGNIRSSLHHARSAHVDAIEADVWVHAGQLIAHHDRPLRPLPFVLGPRGVRREPREPLGVHEVADGVEGHAALFVDLRSWFGDPAPDVARALLPLLGHLDVRVSCESWAIAERLRAWLPELPVAYSVRSERQLRHYFVRRLEGSLPPTAVAVRHTLLHSSVEVEALRAQAGWVNAWTVDDAMRARELGSWGVDAVTSNHSNVLAALD
jgi:glycerophosphoryl diester phosphodiesterase